MSELDQVDADRRRQDRRRCRCCTRRSASPASTSRKLHKETGCFTYDSGLHRHRQLQVSAITYIDGDAGVLLYRGYPIEQLAKHSNFLEVAYLLMNGELPNEDEFANVRARSHASHDDARGLQTFLYGFRHDAHPMAMLVGMLGSLARVLPRHARPRRSRAAPPRRDPPDREGADDRRRLLPLFDRLADPLSAQQPRVRRRASCT